MFPKIKPEDIKKGDWLLFVEHDDNEIVEEVMCVDGNDVWCKSIVNGNETRDSLSDFESDYKDIYKIK